jgi:hypothetical protein
MLSPLASRLRQHIFQATIALVLVGDSDQKKFRILLVIRATPVLVPPQIAKKYNIVEMRTPLAITLRPAALSFTKDQYTNFLSILSLRNWLTSVEERESPKGVLSSLETSPTVAHCHRNCWVQGSLG